MKSRSPALPPETFNSRFGDLSLEEFIQSRWRKRPHLVRQFLPDFVSPVDRDDLFELAGRDDSDSRVVIERGGAYPWEALFGPFEREEFDELPETHWTLLVHEVDRLVPAVTRLLDAFPFLPNWRFDDVMVSYAADGGGVGAHIDRYDVFLLQGEGKRRWRIQEDPIAEERLVPDLDVRILADFRPSNEWVLEPGDLLYLPPRIAHEGVAVGACSTYSIGCRAPSAQDLLAAYLEELAAEERDDEPPADAGDLGRDPAGKIQPSVKAFARAVLSATPAREASFERWLGRYLSRPGRGHAPPESESPPDAAQIRAHLSIGGVVRSAAPSQLLYDTDAEAVRIYAGGREFALPIRYENQAADLTGRAGLRLSDSASADAMPELIDVLVECAASGHVRLEDVD